MIIQPPRKWQKAGGSQPGWLSIIVIGIWYRELWRKARSGLFPRPRQNPKTEERNHIETDRGMHHYNENTANVVLDYLR